MDSANRGRRDFFSRLIGGGALVLPGSIAYPIYEYVIPSRSGKALFAGSDLSSGDFALFEDTINREGMDGPVDFGFAPGLRRSKGEFGIAI